MVNKEERQILRSLASKLASIASLPENDRKRILWTKHNSLKNVRPMMIIYPEGAWSELIPATMLVCTDIKAREIEWKLKAMIYRYEHFHDDFVVEKKWYVNKVIIEPEWSIPIKYNGNDTYTNYLSRYWSNDVVLARISHTPRSLAPPWR